MWSIAAGNVDKISHYSWRKTEQSIVHSAKTQKVQHNFFKSSVIYFMHPARTQFHSFKYIKVSFVNFIFFSLHLSRPAKFKLFSVLVQICLSSATSDLIVGKKYIRCVAGRCGFVWCRHKRCGDKQCPCTDRKKLHLAQLKTCQWTHCHRNVVQWHCLTDLLTDWLIDWLTGWQADGPLCRPSAQNLTHLRWNAGGQVSMSPDGCKH